MAKILYERKRTFRPEDKPTDFLDAYLQQLHKETVSDKSNKFFSEKGLAYTLFGMFQAGTDTTSETLYHGLFHITKNPAIQRRAQKELDDVIGDREVTFADKANLPFLKAVIEETNRFSVLVPLGVVRVTNEDRVICGHKIPANTNVITNLWPASRDAKYFKNPDVFDPNNFLDEQGNFVRNEAMISFSVGKRNCVGEAFARRELFLLFATLLKKFTFTFPQGKSYDDITVQEGFARLIDDYHLCAIPR